MGRRPLIEKYQVHPNTKFKLDDWDPNDNGGIVKGKKSTKPIFNELNEELERLQELLYAENKHKILVVLQATDTGGKDSTIRHVFDGVNPQGVDVASFKRPTEEELAHDFLWRVHRQAPRTGQMVIFNRSHYEDVLVVRVHNLVPEKQWRARYEHIVNFEKLLVDEGTTIVKFYLHIDREEQKERLQERLDEPEKNWKFNPGDLKERARWNDYQQAAEEMMSKTSRSWAPWYVIPANRKWYRNLLISKILVNTLNDLDMKFPPPPPGLDKIEID